MYTVRAAYTPARARSAAQRPAAAVRAVYTAHTAAQRGGAGPGAAGRRAPAHRRGVRRRPRRRLT